MNEFEIIARYFQGAHPVSKGNLKLGIGDDAAIIQLAADAELLVSMDTLVAGAHFFEDAPAEDIACKALAVNLSDMAAMGALPRWLGLSLTLPGYDADWLGRFATAFNRLAGRHSLVLIGGDLSRGPLSVTVQIHGVAPRGKALRRGGASSGDNIYVTGELGAAAHALQCIRAGRPGAATRAEHERLHRPEPRVKTGLALRDMASSCIDISDGLLADLGHILAASELGAEIMLPAIPYCQSLKTRQQASAIELALTGGDDYELCFTLPRDLPAAALAELGAICPVHRIGRTTRPDAGLKLLQEDGGVYQAPCVGGYRHF